MPTRKKNDFTGFTKEIINTEESNKSINIRFIVDGKTNFSKMDLDFLDNCTKI